MNVPKKLSPAETQKANTLSSLMQQQLPAIRSILGSQEMAENFTRIVLTLVRTNPKLAECDAPSFLGALMQGAQLKLNFHLGLAWMIPRWSSVIKSQVAVFQIGYLGWIELFYRHPLASELYAEVVYQNDYFSIRKGTDRKIEHVPYDGDDPGPAIGYYAVAKIKTGGMDFAYMTMKQMIAHMNTYVEGNSSAWNQHFDAMAKKTVIVKALKLLPKSIEIATALSFEGSVRRPISENEKLNIGEVPAIYPTVGEDKTLDPAKQPMPTIIDVQQETSTPKTKAAPKAKPVTKPQDQPTADHMPEDVPFPDEPVSVRVNRGDNLKQKQHDDLSALKEKAINDVELSKSMPEQTRLEVKYNIGIAKTKADLDEQLMILELYP